jgi:tetratricopeptide (TPR) repeat protein
VSDATASIAQLIAQYPQLAAVQLANGKILFARNELTGARTAFTRALENGTTRAEALEALLRIDAREKTVPAAVTRIEQYAAKEPKNAALHYLAAQTYAAAGNQAKTEQSLRQVIELAPDSMEAYLALGRLYVTQKKLDEARTEFDHAAARRPNEVAPATMAAMILQMQDKPEDARKRYEAIVTQSQQRAPIAANNLAWIYAESGQNLDTALQLAQSAKAQLPDSAAGRRHARVDLCEEEPPGAGAPVPAGERHERPEKRAVSVPSRRRIREEGRHSQGARRARTRHRAAAELPGCDPPHRRRCRTSRADVHQGRLGQILACLAGLVLVGVYGPTIVWLWGTLDAERVAQRARRAGPARRRVPLVHRN